MHGVFMKTALIFLAFMIMIMFLLFRDILMILHLQIIICSLRNWLNGRNFDFLEHCKLNQFSFRPKRWMVLGGWNNEAVYEKVFLLKIPSLIFAQVNITQRNLMHSDFNLVCSRFSCTNGSFIPILFDFVNLF